MIDGQRFVDRQWRIVACWCLCEFCCWWVGLVGAAFAFDFDLSAFGFVQVIVGPFVSIVCLAFFDEFLDVRWTGIDALIVQSLSLCNFH